MHMCKNSLLLIVSFSSLLQFPLTHTFFLCTSFALGAWLSTIVSENVKRPSSFYDTYRFSPRRDWPLVTVLVPREFKGVEGGGGGGQHVMENCCRNEWKWLLLFFFSSKEKCPKAFGSSKSKKSDFFFFCWKVSMTVISDHCAVEWNISPKVTRGCHPTWMALSARLQAASPRKQLRRLNDVRILQHYRFLSLVFMFPKKC